MADTSGPWDQYRASATNADAADGPWRNYGGNGPAPEPKRTLGGTARDIGVTALKGAVGLPQAVVGLADIPTGGWCG